MYSRLQKIYFTALVPVLVGFGALTAFRPGIQDSCLAARSLEIVAPSLFLLTVVCAIAGPIFYRALFAHHHRYVTQVSRSVFFRFERNLTLMVLVAPYLALAAYFLQLPRFHLAAMLLMTLYAVYFYYPSRRRVSFDMTIYRTPGG